MASTIRSYKNELARFNKYHVGAVVKEITVERIIEYLNARPVNGKADGTSKSTATLNRLKSVIRSFFGWCEMRGLVKQDPSAGIRCAAASEQTLNDLIHTRRGISPEMAIRLDLAFGGGADTWLRLQAAYELCPGLQDRKGQNQG